MRMLGTILLFLSLGAHAEQCGLFQINDYGDRISYTLVNFNKMAPQTLYYRVINETSPIVRGMMNGLCYCVEGVEVQDPAYHGDLMYRLLTVRSITAGPSSDCNPAL